MPTSTYFRLPEEKRRRLTDACWSQCCQNRLADVSINQIIAAAHIPRGSFYQYFTGKEDMIQFLLGDMQDYFIAQFRRLLDDCGGDLLDLPLAAFDRLVRPQGDTDPVLARFIQILKLNQELDIHAFLAGESTFLPDPIWEKVDGGRLRCQDRRFADHVFHLICAALAFSVAEVLKDPGQWQQQRTLLQERMDIIKNGSAAQAAAIKGGRS